MLLTAHSGEKIPIHFFVGPKNRVVDVSIEGVSIANHYRGSFARFLVNKPLEALLEQLERKPPSS